LFVFFLAFSLNAFSQPKIGYIDKEIVLKQMPEYKKVEDEYKAFEKLYADSLQARKSEIITDAEIFQKKYEEVQEMIKNKQITSESEAKVYEDSLSAMQERLKAMQDEYNSYLQKVQDVLAEKQQALLKPLLDKISKVVEDVAKELKYNFIFDKQSGSLQGSLLYGDRDFDVTFKVLDKLK